MLLLQSNYIKRQQINLHDVKSFHKDREAKQFTLPGTGEERHGQRKMLRYKWQERQKKNTSPYNLPSGVCMYYAISVLIETLPNWHVM